MLAIDYLRINREQEVIKLLKVSHETTLEQKESSL